MNRQPPDADATAGFPGPSITDDLLTRLHRLLVDRGWDIGRWNPDEDGMPVDPETNWEYPAAYQGAQFNRDGAGLGDVAPYYPQVFFEWADSHDPPRWIVVTTAGNWTGCEWHNVTEQRLPACLDDTTELVAALDAVESAARGLDVRELIQCRFFGPCGRDQQR